MELTTSKYNLEGLSLMEHVCTVTALSKKLAGLLQNVKELDKPDDEHAGLAAYVDETAAACSACIDATMKRASADAGIPVELLKRAAIIYSAHDAVTVAASFREKIAQWKLAFALAENEAELSGNTLTYRLYDVFSDAFTVPPELSKDDIIEELNDHAGEIEAWLDIEFPDEATECEDGTGHKELEAFFDIIAKLRLMAEEIEKIR